MCVELQAARRRSRCMQRSRTLHSCKVGWLLPKCCRKPEKETRITMKCLCCLRSWHQPKRQDGINLDRCSGIVDGNLFLWANVMSSLRRVPAAEVGLWFLKKPRIQNTDRVYRWWKGTPLACALRWRDSILHLERLAESEKGAWAERGCRCQQNVKWVRGLCS